MNLLVLPLLVPLLTAVILLLVPRRPLLQRSISFAGSVAEATVAIMLFIQVEQQGIQVLQSGGWAAPFGITLVADLLTALLIAAAGIVGLAVAASSFAGVDPKRETSGYHGLLHVLLMGVAGAFLTGDLFNLYVWFEVMLVASFVLMSLHRTQAQLQAAFKYVTLNLLASSLFLTALGLLYGSTGTLNMADLAVVFRARQITTFELVLAVLFLVAFGVKAALFPLFFWLPASYHTPPAAVGAIFAGLLTKVGVYSLIRVITLLYPHAPPVLYNLILVQAGCTMIAGLIGAVAQRDFRRVLSFNLVGHIGYTTVGLALMTPSAMAGSIVYMLHHIFVITNLYLISGIFLRLRRTTDLASLGSIYRNQPIVAVVAMIPLFSLAGVPPLSGFVGKLALLRGTFDAGAFWTSAVILIVGVLTLLSMARLWDEAFWKPAPHADKTTLTGAVLAPIACLTVMTLGFTVAAEPVLRLASRASDQLLQPQGYIDAVLKGGSRQ
ncbi:MAG TPA: proton-conducting transporter membrane subunit [Bryobacteraceae bacterium]|nr:proton-conducting transporter membrane subunit [Bryobacteraceae bacterium]